jgi:hypothetical protein
VEIKLIKDTPRRGGTFCYSIVKDEAWLLPHFLSHYRSLGISFFVFFDDSSTDDTLELLLSQPDCAVLTADGHVSPSFETWGRLQTSLSNSIPEHFGAGGWSITADADEFLLLPSRFETIGQLTEYLDVRELKCVQGPLIDFYPARLSERLFGDISPFEGAPWFDPDPLFVRPFPQVRPTLLSSGIRARLLKIFAQRHPHKCRELFGSLSPPSKFWLVKVPLLKTGCGILRTTPHHVDVIPPMGIQAAFAHFKFLPASDQKIKDTLEGKIFGGAHSLLYKFFDAAFEYIGDELLVTERSVRYEGAASVEAAGLMWAD